MMIRMIQDLLDGMDLMTTMFYTHSPTVSAVGACGAADAH
jgi:hypothetical protein